MNDVVIKYAAGQCNATSCGSKNPIAAMIAKTMLTEMNSFSVAQAQEAAVQSVGNAMTSSGIALG